ncbi:MAG: hypothetical protein QM790_10450 [Nibricoccus sp.]
MSTPEEINGAVPNSTCVFNDNAVHTALEIRNAMIIPNLKLAGIVTSDGEQVALINSTRLRINQETQLNVDGLPVKVRCVSIDAKSAVIYLFPGETKVSLRPGAAAEISR